ncbi:MAG: hypothetical protein MI674_04395 [Cytophagales bacterium]|nr:hypothetical protein [Cytophagales bacterium]
MLKHIKNTKIYILHNYYDVPFGLLTWQVYLLLKILAFAGHTTRNSELKT